jgi:hypothetical protein
VYSAPPTVSSVGFNNWVNIDMNGTLNMNMVPGFPSVVTYSLVIASQPPMNAYLGAGFDGPRAVRTAVSPSQRSCVVRSRVFVEAVVVALAHAFLLS